MASPSLNINIKASDADAHKALGRLQKDVEKVGGQVDKTKQSTTSFGDALRDIAGPAVFAAGLYKATQAASDLAEAQSKVVQVFGESDAIEDFAEGAAQAIGQSERQALDATGTFGNLLIAFGLAGEEAQRMSIDMVKLASDLASFNNTSVEDAIEALRSGLSGESEPLKRYGVALNDARMKEEALTLGIYDGVGALNAAQKAQATYAVVMKDTAKAQGDFERTSDGAANQSKIAKAEFDNAAASLGENLLPVMTLAAGAAGDLAAVVGALPGPIQTALIALGGAALIGPKVAAGFTMMKTATMAAGTAATRMATDLVVPTKAVEGLGSTSTATAGATSKMGTAMAALGWAGAIAGAAAYGASLNEVKVNSAETLKATDEELRQAFITFENFGSEGEEVYKKLGDQSIEALYAIRDAAGPAYTEQSKLAEAIRNAEEGQARQNERTAEYAGVVDEATGATSDLGAADDDTAGRVRNNNSAYQSRADLLKEINDEQQEAIDRAFGAAGAADDYERSVQDTAKAADELLWLRNSGQATAEELAEAERKLDGAIRDQAQAADDAWRTQAELEGAHYDAATSAAVQKRELERASVAVGEMTDGTAGLIDELEQTEVERQIKIDRSELLKAIEATNILNEKLGYTRPTESGTTRPGQDPALGQTTRPRPTESLTPGPRGQDPALSRAPAGNVIVQGDLNVGGIKGVADLNRALAARDHQEAERVMIGG